MCRKKIRNLFHDLLGLCNEYGTIHTKKFRTRVPEETSVDPDQTAPFQEQSGLGLHCLLYCKQHFENSPSYNSAIFNILNKFSD